MSATEKPSLGLSVLAALIALGALPFGFALFAVQSHEVAEAWNEGGPGMYAVLAAASLATLIGAIGAFFAPRGVLGVWAGGAFIALAMSAIGTMAYGSGVTGTFKAVAHASPDDRPIIMRGGLGECTQLLVLTAALAAGLFVMQGLAMLVGRLAAKEQALKKSLLLLGLGLLAIGAWQGLSAAALAGEGDALQAFAHAGPNEKLTLVVDGFDRMASSRQLSLIALGLALLLAVGGAVLLRADRRLAAGVLFGILVPAVGLGGARAAARIDPEVTQLMARPAFTQELVELDAPPAEVRFTRLSVRTQLTDGYGDAPSLESLAGRELDLTLEAGVTWEALVKALHQLRAAKVSSLMLVGTKKTAPPATVPAIWEAQFNEPRGLPLDLLSSAECGESCKKATVDGKGLTWGSETWPLKTSSYFPAYELKAIPLALEGLTLESLLAACHTAGEQGAKIALVLPD